jgi:hypothetical protein
MTKYYSHWHLNPMLIPPNPEERIKLWMKLLEQVKVDLKSGDMLDWGLAADLSCGYAIMETDEMGILAEVAKHQPFIVGECKPVVTTDQAGMVLKKAAAAMKSK